MKNKKGFTLVEIIVAFSISMVIITISSTLIFVSAKSLNSHLNFVEEIKVVNIMYEKMQKILKFANEIQIAESTSSQDPPFLNSFVCEDDRIYFNGVKLDGGVLKESLKVNYTVLAQGNVLTIKISLYNNENILIYETGSSFKIDMMIYSKKTIKAIEGYEFINPKIYYLN